MALVGFWDSLQEQQFMECLEKRNFDGIEKLSCFNGYSPLRGSTAKKLVEKIFIEIDEDNPDIQEKYYLMLDNIIDGICQNRYKNNHTFYFKSNNQIDYFMKEKFNDANNNFHELQEYNNSYIRMITNILQQKIFSNISYWSDCYRKVLELYEEYKRTGDIPRKLSNDFYNGLLNIQRNNYISNIRADMIKNLCISLPYTKRKENSIIISAKMKKIDEIFQNKRYEELGITLDYLKDKLTNFNEYLSSLKELKKENVVVDEYQVSMMTDKFLEGILTVEDVQSICSGVTLKIAKLIFDKYTQIKMQFLNNVSIDDALLSRQSLGYNYNNYKIVNQNRYYANLTKIFSVLYETEAQRLLEEADINKNIFDLVFFIDYFKELNVRSVLDILMNYSRIVRDADNLNELTFDKLYLLGKAYSNVDDFSFSILGVDAVDRIVHSTSLTSKDVSEYINIYCKMLKRDKTQVPLVYGEYEDYYYESGKDYDIERLLLSKYSDFSCVGPDGAGEEAFLSSLTGYYGDVILFKDKKTDEFEARCLMFRNGNYVVIAPIYGKDGIEEKFYNKELMKNISSQLLNQSKVDNDTIEYIFMTPYKNLLENDFNKYENKLELYDFPHADLNSDVLLIGSINSNQEVNLNNNSSDIFYNTKRKNVMIGDKVSNEDYNKLRALNIAMMDDRNTREEEIRDFVYKSRDRFDDIFWDKIGI